MGEQTLYEELLASCKERFDNFFSTVNLFENQFCYNNFNKQCYDYMYKNNRYQNIFTVKELKDCIPILKESCKKCGNFYMSIRNKSIPKYDVILGEQHENALMEFLENKLNVKVVRADLQNRSMPDCKILKSDGSVAAYFEVKFHGAPFIMALNKIERYCYEGSATLDYNKIIKQLKLINEELKDTPVFYIHWIDYPCLKGIFYETSVHLETYINQQHEFFERKKRIGDEQKAKKSIYLKKIYSPLLDLKSFEEFIEELGELTKN